MAKKFFKVSFSRPDPAHKQRSRSALKMCNFSDNDCELLLGVANGDWSDKWIVHCCTWGCCESVEVRS